MRQGAALTPLRPGAPLGVAVQACLGCRPHYQACAACAEACPAGVLRATGGVPVLADGCLSCGRCVAACHTGALSLRGFIATPAGAVTALECARVPARLRASGAAVVGCLGGLTVADLLDFADRADRAGVPLRLIDRGWCADCPAGGDTGHPAAGALAMAAAATAALGLASPQPVSVPTAAAKAAALRPADDRLDHTRRRLFSAPFRLSADGAAAPAHDLRAPLAVPGRERLLSTAGRIAAARGLLVPAMLFPALNIEDACRDHRVCAAVCPTRALRAIQAEKSAALTFDAAACIACGRCAAACPESALTLLGERRSAEAAGPATLRQGILRECGDCGDGFMASADGEAGLCPLCRKRFTLMRAAFAAPLEHGDKNNHLEQGECA